jgi:hypothetical protein
VIEVVVAVAVVKVAVVAVTVDVVHVPHRAGQTSGSSSTVLQSSSRTNSEHPAGSFAPLHSGISTQVPQVTRHSDRATSPAAPCCVHRIAAAVQLGSSGTPLH